MKCQNCNKDANSTGFCDEHEVEERMKEADKKAEWDDGE